MSVKSRELSGKKAMFSLLNKVKQNFLPVDISLEMFEKMVIPCMLYGSEIWGYNNIISLERVQLKFIKYLLKLKPNTPTVMVYGETGRLPIQYHVNISLLRYWVSLVTGGQDKYSCRLYQMSMSLYNRKFLDCKWLNKIKEILIACGMPFVFDEQNTLDKNWLKNSFLLLAKNILKDQILQNWYNTVFTESEKCFYYKNFGAKYEIKNYFSILPKDLWIPFCRFRTGNHKFPVEVFSWTSLYTPRTNRKCTICNLNDIGDEYHYLMTCPVFEEFRDLYLPDFYKNRPSVFKFIQLMTTTNPKLLFRLAKLIREILAPFE